MEDDLDLAAILTQRRHRSWLTLAWANSVMAWLLVIFALVTATCSCARPETVAKPRAQSWLTPEAQDARSVRVDVACVGGDFMADQIIVRGHWGSGVLTDSLHVLTAGHVAACDPGTAALVYVQGRDGSRRMAHRQRGDVTRDLAVLELDVPFPPLGELVVAAPRTGEYLCMTPSMPAVERKCGVVDLIKDTRLADKTIDVAMRAIAIPGNSGSPMWDAAGRLVCVVTNSRSAPDGGWCSSVLGHMAI